MIDTPVRAVQDSPQPILTCVGLSKRYGSLQVLKNVELSVAANEIVVLLGENGAGKTTLMRLLSGELLPDSGSSSRRWYRPARPTR